MSHLLFNIAFEVLHIILVKAESLSIIKGIKLKDGPYLSHLEFVSDIVIFLEEMKHSCRGIKVILTIFEILSGLKINFHKSLLYTSRTDEFRASALTDLIGCKRRKWPLASLGINILFLPRERVFVYQSLRKSESS